MPEPGAPDLLRTEGLSKHFRGLQVNRDISLSIPTGRRHAIIGPNGAGKTTLFNLLAGELAPSAGRIFLEGRDITRRRPDQRARLGLSRSFQKNNLFEGETVRSNLLLADIARRGYGHVFWRRLSAGRAALEKAEEIAAAVQLQDQLARPVRELSYGACRQLEVGLALMAAPKLLLLDEPTSGMSPEETGLMMRLIDSLPAELTILIIEHEMDVVFAHAERITVLNYGEVLLEGTPDEVRRSEVVQRTYLGLTEEGAV